ncbi:MAG: hypothetical protein ACUVTB_04050 [Candidatus Bathycorpusculaceae bacterium]
MSSLIFVKKNRVSAAFWLGAVLILAGIVVSLYVDSVIKVHEEKLFSPFSDLTQEERWALEGSYQWWRMARITFYYPLSIILIAVGLVVLSYSFISAIRQRSPLPSFQRRLQTE